MSNNELAVTLNNPAGLLYKVLYDLRQIDNDEQFHKYLISELSNNVNIANNEHLSSLDIINFQKFLYSLCDKSIELINSSKLINKTKEKLKNRINHIKILIFRIGENLFRHGVDNNTIKHFKGLISNTLLESIEICSDNLSEFNKNIFVDDKNKIEEIIKDIDILCGIIENSNFELTYKKSLLKILNKLRSSILTYENYIDKDEAQRNLEALFGTVLFAANNNSNNVKDENKKKSLISILTFIKKSSSTLSAINDVSDFMSNTLPNLLAMLN